MNALQPARPWLLAGALTLASCSGGTSAPQSGAPSAAVVVTGEWSASISVQRQGGGTAYTADLRLKQLGDGFTGSLQTQRGGAGELKGMLSGRELQFTLSQLLPCSGSFFGSARVSASGRRMSGSYSGSDCDGTLHADFQARRVDGARPQGPPED